MGEFALTPIADIIIVSVVFGPSSLLCIDELKEAEVKFSSPDVCQWVNLKRVFCSVSKTGWHRKHTSS